MRRLRVTRGGLRAFFAVSHQANFHAAVLCPSGGRIVGRDRVIRFSELTSVQRARDGERLRGSVTLMVGFPSGSRLRIGVMGLGAASDLGLAFGDGA